MADHDQLLRRARSELTLGGGQDPVDWFVWDHALRVKVSADMIARLPELTGKQIDSMVLQTAALYHDAGWAIQVEQGQVARARVLTRPTNDVQFELAAELVESSLKGALPTRTIRRGCQAIRGIRDRQCELIEAHIVSDADNLDQIGPLGFLQSLRRDLAEGRALDQVLESWHRQQEYHYWEARIRDGIRFEAVRDLAWRRLAAMDPFMKALGEHVDAHDLAALLGIPAGDRPKRPQVAS
jgi:hypothetical protein